MMIVASLMQAFSLTYATRVVLSKTNLYFDLWHGKHSVTQSRAVLFFLKLLIIIIIIIIIIILFFFLASLLRLFDFYYFGFLSKFRVVPGRFRGVPSGSG